MQTDPTTAKGSLLRVYSLGVAAANLKFGQKELEVTPIEDLSQLDGELTDVQIKIESTGVDKDGNTFATSEKVSNTVKAMWLPLDTYRAFPGLIRRGERVLLWRVGDTDKYYWTEMGIDDTTRRKDILTILIPNSPKENEDSRTPDTAYFIEVNTVDKHITIQTNKHDGEPYAYLWQINTKDGVATLCDDVGNYYQLNSKLQKLIMKNQMGSEVSIEKGKGIFKTPESILIDTKKLDVKVKEFNINTNTLDCTAKSYKWSGGSYTLKTKTITHLGINIGGTHKHPGVQSGQGMSMPPI